MKPETLKIDDVEYVRKDSVQENKNLSKDIRIVVLQRGWIAVGRYSENGDECKLENSMTIRKWGTTKGLGELINGPISGTTVLDSAGTHRFHKLAIVFTLDCEASKWAQHLK